MKTTWIFPVAIGVSLIGGMALGFLLFGGAGTSPNKVASQPKAPPAASEAPEKAIDAKTGREESEAEEPASAESSGGNARYVLTMEDATSQTGHVTGSGGKTARQKAYEEWMAAKREMFEAKAREALPLTSVMSNDPRWKKGTPTSSEAEGPPESSPSPRGTGSSLRNAGTIQSTADAGAASASDADGGTGDTDAASPEAAGDPGDNAGPAAPADTETPEGPLAVELDEGGEFGRLGPSEGHVWIRMDPAYAQQSKEVMAQTADLYRDETGYAGEVTVTLWVGGQPHSRYSYE